MPRELRPLALRAAVDVAPATDPKKPRTFRMVANTGEPMRIWPYDLPVVVDLDTVDASGLPVPALYDHCPDVDYAVGQVTAAAVQEGELVASGVFTVTDGGDPDRNYGRKVLDKADAGYRWQTSIGGDPKSVEEIKAGASAVVNGRTYAGPVLIARGVTLREISFVVLGGDRRTSAVVARTRRRPAHIKGAAAMSFEEFVQSMGFDPASLDETQAANMKNLFAEKYPEGDGEEVAAAEGEEETPAPPADEPVAAAGEETDEEEPTPPTNAAANPPKLAAKVSKADRAAIAASERAAERKRAATITTLCNAHGAGLKVKAAGGVSVPLAAHAVSEGWTVERVQAHLLKHKRADRPTGPGIIVASHDRSCTAEALTGALILRSRGKLDHPAYLRAGSGAAGIPAWLRAGINDPHRNRVMEAAHRFADLSAVDLCREALRLDRKDAPHGRHDAIRAAFSGSSLTNIFTTSVNAILLATYAEAEDTTQGWVTEQDVADFRTQERPRMLVGPGLSKLPRGGEADHMKRSDAGETYKIARYAGQFVIDEQDVIDDMLGALADMPDQMGRAAARLRPDLVYAIILDNPTLTTTGRDVFNSTDGNTQTTSALASGTLKSAIKIMQLFRENGVNLNVKATHLIVPPALRHTAAELINSATVFKSNGASSTVEFGSANSIQMENLTLVSDARLENGVTDPATGTALSGSASTWYTGSNQVQTIEVGYLRGTGRAPRVRPFPLDKGKYGAGWDVSMDIGAKAMDWKGFTKSEASG